MFGFRGALLCLMALYTYICPFTKVEESFNMQAMHDLIFVRNNLSRYDHLDFPGVVPRTFIGAVFVDLAASIPLYLSIILESSKFIFQLIVRLCLGSLNVWCLGEFCATVRKKFGKSVYNRLCFITLTQFHFLFYISRALPNSFALSLVLLSLAYLLHNRDKEFVALAGFAILVFRSELILFYGPCLMYGLIQGSVRLRPSLLLTVLFTAIGSVAISVVIDSLFWQKIIWPEGVVFYFNTILNKSSQWGRSPFHWYFTSALPRAMLASSALLPCWLPFAMQSLILSCRGHEKISFQPASVGLVLVGFTFVTLYSILPHKELRFIIYAIPIFNLAAATVWSHLEQSASRLLLTSRHKSTRKSCLSSLKFMMFRLITWFCYGHLLVNLIGTVILLMAARGNYPGGQALVQLNQFSGLDHRKNVHIHICNLAAQTGVTRFLEEHNHWIYNKTEGIEGNITLLEQSTFTHLISEIPPDKMRAQTDTFRPLFVVDGFDGIRMQLNWPMVWQLIQFRTSPHLTVYERTR